MASILLVDDDEMIRDFVYEALRRAGHSVQKAGNGREGLAALEQGLFDLVLVDLMMPVMNGLEMIQAMRERGLLHRVIAMSGGATPTGPSLAGAVEAGAAHTLQKPFRMGDLITAVNSYLPQPG